MAGHFSPGYSLLTGPATTPPYQESKEKREIRFTVCYKTCTRRRRSCFVFAAPLFFAPNTRTIDRLEQPPFFSLLFLVNPDGCMQNFPFLSLKQFRQSSFFLFCFVFKSSWFRYGRALTGVMIWGGLYDHAH